MKREVTRLRSKACRWDDFRPRCRYFRAPPAIVRRRGGGFFFSLSPLRSVLIRLQDTSGVGGGIVEEKNCRLECRTIRSIIKLAFNRLLSPVGRHPPDFRG